MLVSTPEATALDLIRYSGHAGGMSNVATVLSELAEKIAPDRLVEAARREADLAAAQRLGFLLDCVEASGKTEPLAAWVEQERPRPVALRPDREVHGAPKNRRWQVLVNEQIEVSE
jgi:predicted transcriptional regulator of viral defense system